MELQIYIYNGSKSGYLDLNPGTRLDFESTSDAFDEDLTTGEFTLPVEIPWSENNRRILDFSEQIVNFKKPLYYWRCDVYEQGWPQITGAKFTLLERRGNFNFLRGNFSASISSTKGLFGNLIRNKRLTDLNLGSIITYATESRVFAEAVMRGTISNYPYLRFAPVAIENFIDTNRSDYDNEFLAKDTVNNVIVNGSTWTFGRPQSTSPDIATISGTEEHKHYRTIPFIQFQWLLRKCFETFEFKVKGDFIDDLDYKDLVIFNNYSLEKYTGPGADYNRQMDLRNHVPDFAIDEFLQAILSAFKLKMSFTGPQEVTLRYKKTGLRKAGAVDITDFVTEDFESILPGTEQANGYKIAYQWDESDQFITDRIKDLKEKTFCATVQTAAQLSTLDIGRPLTTDDYAYVEAENMFYLVANASNPSNILWDAYSENLDAYVSGDGERSVDIPLSTLCQYAEFDTAQALWIRRNYLGCRQPGSYTAYSGSTVKNKFGLRLFFAGMRTVDGVVIPNSYNYNRNPVNNTVTGKYSLALNGPDGLVATLHKEWEDMLQNKQVIKVNLLHNTRLMEQLRKASILRIQNTFFVLQKTERSIPADITALAELVPL